MKYCSEEGKSQRKLSMLVSDMQKECIRGRLFEINDVVSKRFVKISNVNITNTLFFCCWKKCENFFTAKILTFFQQK